MLRRLKIEIEGLNLPKRNVKEVQCEFENMERDTYESLAIRLQKSLNRAAQVQVFPDCALGLSTDHFRRTTT